MKVAGEPHGGRANMGAHGDTAEASKGKWVIPGDANGDCRAKVMGPRLLRSSIREALLATANMCFGSASIEARK